LSGTLTVSAVDGIASFSDVRIDQSGLDWQLVATTPGLSSATSTSFAAVGATPRRLAFLEQPSDQGGGFSFHISIVVQDSIGNTVATYNQPITLTIGANPGGATPLQLTRTPYTGPANVISSPGVANFGFVRIDQRGFGYTLVATAAGLESATTLPFDINP